MQGCKCQDLMRGRVSATSIEDGEGLRGKECKKPLKPESSPRGSQQGNGDLSPTTTSN